MKALIVVLVSGLLAALPTTAQQITPVQNQQQQFDYQRALRNLQAIQAGKKKLDQLPPHEQIEVHLLVRYLSRPKAPNSSPACRDAWDRASSAADDVSSYANRLKKCVDAGDYTEDCSNEFRRVKNAHSDYESASSDVESYCR